MPLWRVDVGGVSHRFVEAATKKAAVEQVERALLDAMDIRATAADPHVTATYHQLGPIQRKNMLVRLDGLTNPQERQQSKAAQRRLARLLELEKQEAAWVASALAGAPPVSPAAADELARLLAVKHVERNYEKLPEWDRHSPIHSEKKT